MQIALLVLEFSFNFYILVLSPSLSKLTSMTCLGFKEKTGRGELKLENG